MHIGRRHGDIFQDLLNVIRSCTWNNMKPSSQITRSSNDQDNAPAHCCGAVPGWVFPGEVVAGWLPLVAGTAAPGLVGAAPSGRGAACTMTASDEAKARMETKEAVEMAYMILKQTLG